MNMRMLTTLCVVTAIAAPVSARLVEVDFTPDTLAIAKGSLGTSLTIDDLYITSLADLEAPTAGTLYLEMYKGLGVRSLADTGATAITWDGGNSNEAVVFDFTNNVEAASVVIKLNCFEDRYDSPKLILQLSGSPELTFTESHPNWSAATSVSRKKITIDIGGLLGANTADIVSKIIVAETTGSVFVKNIAYEITAPPVPEPATIVLLGVGGFVMIVNNCKRK